ncbi:hypothetical protein B0T16DRAFT_406881 [Cercophora newfieldiana]|uniref:Integral membrane protein n=1 Tax=Cercophora newfieldiana TaxID=92897 RepID=A0AA39YKS8_9PEZI|nr:hypothetical protein B0T16DRAFT_406881 [Cercophora newfieldiana]
MALRLAGRGPVASPLRRIDFGQLSATTVTAILAAAFLPMALGHEHDEGNIPDGETVSAEPIDTTLWIHIFVQMFAFGILFPLGMVLGIIKSRWHVPLQVLATAIALLGYALGHLHGGRQFVSSNVHAKFGTIIFFLMVGQVALGIYLKLHLEKGINGRIRPIIRRIHGINGKAFPVVSWVQMLFGGITALGFCQGDHLGQCLAHFIMGSAFIAYGILLTLLLLVGQLWLRRTGRSQEFFDSVVIAAWGCVNTFTEHRWGTAWVRNDWQHTTMGIVWWCAGLAGVWLSRDRDGSPKRNFIPGFVILITGWAMSAHPQDMMISAMVHKVFGYNLMGVGITRIIEISFVLHDKPGMAEDGSQSHSFQYVPIFLLFASGFMFMGATEEQMALVKNSGMDAVAYILILYSLAFLLFLFVHMLIYVYDRSANAQKLAQPVANGRAAPGTRTEEDGRLGDAGEFELEGLMTDDEDEDDASRRNLLKHGEDDLASPNPALRNGGRS